MKYGHNHVSINTDNHSNQAVQANNINLNDYVGNRG